jgi:hypothetical protein
MSGDLLGSVVNHAFNCNEKIVSHILSVLFVFLFVLVLHLKKSRCAVHFFIWFVRQARRQGLVIFFCANFACAAQGRVCKTLFCPGFTPCVPLVIVRFILSFHPGSSFGSCFDLLFTRQIKSVLSSLLISPGAVLCSSHGFSITASHESMQLIFILLFH